MHFPKTSSRGGEPIVLYRPHTTSQYVDMGSVHNIRPPIRNNVLLGQGHVVTASWFQATTPRFGSNTIYYRTIGTHFPKASSRRGEPIVLYKPHINLSRCGILSLGSAHNKTHVFGDSIYLPSI